MIPLTFQEHLTQEFAQSKQAILFALGNLPGAKTIVVNIGVNSLVHDTGLLNIRNFKNFIKDISELINAQQNRHVVIVVSDYLKQAKYLQNHEMPSKNSGLYSALVALVQNDLANLFSDEFSEYSLRAIGLPIGDADNHSEHNKTIKTLETIVFSQAKSSETKIEAIRALLNSKKTASKKSSSLKKISETIRGLFRHFPRAIPIIMEDPTHTGNLGDEEFAAGIAIAINADALVAISQKGMLFTTDPGKKKGSAAPFYCYDSGRKSPFAKARQQALAKKINAASLVNGNTKPIPMLLAASDRPFAIANMFSEDTIADICGGAWPKFTLFVDSGNPALPIEARHISGKIVIDKNAVKALVDEKGSLLLAGVVEIAGEFDARQVVSIVDQAGVAVGVGVVGHSAQEIAALMGGDAAVELISRDKMRVSAG